MTLHGVIMQFLTIRHVTTYRYRRPVAFGEHRMMLHPRDSHDQRVIQANLKISPEPTNLCFVQDAFGNNVGIARFSRRSKELSFESVVCLEHSPSDAALVLENAVRSFPVDYSVGELPDLAPYIERHHHDARFASGYLAVPPDDSQEPTSGSVRGSTHAWAQIYLPGVGWIDFDPTSGGVGNVDLVTVAVVPDPRHAIPLHGTFIGFPSDHLGMEVQVSVMSGAPKAIGNAPPTVRASTNWPISVIDVERGTANMDRSHDIR
jgi:Bacterial transglutaminase-like N-terminal region/Transglutaminase-like superfamily